MRPWLVSVLLVLVMAGDVHAGERNLAANQIGLGMLTSTGVVVGTGIAIGVGSGCVDWYGGCSNSPSVRRRLHAVSLGVLVPLTVAPVVHSRVPAERRRAAGLVGTWAVTTASMGAPVAMWLYAASLPDYQPPGSRWATWASLAAIALPPIAAAGASSVLQVRSGPQLVSRGAPGWGVSGRF